MLPAIRERPGHIVTTGLEPVTSISVLCLLSYITILIIAYPINGYFSPRGKYSRGRHYTISDIPAKRDPFFLQEITVIKHIVKDISTIISNLFCRFTVALYAL